MVEKQIFESVKGVTRLSKKLRSLQGPYHLGRNRMRKLATKLPGYIAFEMYLFDGDRMRISTADQTEPLALTGHLPY